MRRVKPTTTTTVPNNVLALSVSTRRTPPHAEAPGGVVFLAGACVHRERLHGRWVRRAAWAGDERADVWDGVRAACHGRRSLTVVSRRPADDFTLLGGWRVAKVHGWTLRPLAVSDSCQLIGWTLDGCRVRWTGPRSHGDPAIPLTGDPAADCDALSDWYTGMLTGWVSAGGGVYRHTAGAAAWATFRRRMGPPGLVVHSDPAALELEDAACHGGRAELFWRGWSEEPGTGGRHDHEPCPPPGCPARTGALYRVDVRGQYPSVMRDHPFPTRLVGVKTGWDADRVRWWCDRACLIADVTVRTARSEYPAVVLGRPCHPVGEFRTTLATPELVAGIDRGEVTAVHRCAVYERGPVFRPWAEWVLSLRGTADKFHHPAWAGYVKSLAVALSGRLARRAGGWEDVAGEAAGREWGEWCRVDADSGEVERWRSLGGHVQRLVRAGRRDGVLAACYAHVTAYGRCQMREVREWLPDRQVIAQHTDGLTVTEFAHTLLRDAGRLDSGTWGTLRTEARADRSFWLSPNHFWADGKWTWAGLSSGAVISPDHVAADAVPVSPVQRACDPQAGSLAERVRVIDLMHVAGHTRFADDGWAIPPRVGVNLPLDAGVGRLPVAGPSPDDRPPFAAFPAGPPLPSPGGPPPPPERDG